MPAKLLFDLWRWGVRVDPAPLRRDSGSIGLWRSPCGLAFFHPAFEGSGRFYDGLYGPRRIHEGLGAAARRRPDLAALVALARPGDAVLEVGCGHGALAALLPPGVRYQGLEPHGTPPPGGPLIAAETVAAHAACQAGTYDLACAFHVVEHVADPLGMARDMVACLRPGGHLVLAMPAWPSALTDLPNNLVNLPPHHLSWWTEEACLALAARLGLEEAAVRLLPPAPMEAVVFWARRFSPVRTRPGEWLKPSWRWHLSALLALRVGALAARLFGLPRDATPIDVLLVAKKPG